MLDVVNICARKIKKYKSKVTDMSGDNNLPFLPVYYDKSNTIQSYAFWTA